MTGSPGSERKPSDGQRRQHQTTTIIARTYGTVVVEALTITNMVKSARGTVDEPVKNVTRKAGLNCSIAAEAWGRTVRMLMCKTARNGGTLVKVPAPGTSQRCSACGFTTAGSRGDTATINFGSSPIILPMPLADLVRTCVTVRHGHQSQRRHAPPLTTAPRRPSSSARRTLPRLRYVKPSERALENVRCV